MAEHRHKRETNARFQPRAIVIAGPLAVVATVGAVSLGVAASEPDTRDLMSVAGNAIGTPGLDRTSRELGSVSRDLDRSDAARTQEAEPTALEQTMRPKAVQRAVNQADTRLWTTEALNLWSQPGEQAEQLGELDAGEKVLVTGRTMWEREEIVLDGQARWVTAGYLSEEKPTVLGGDCTNGTSVPSGVSANIVSLHRAVCAAFPDITTYGTLRADGEHAQGIAVDIMVSGDRGWEVAEFVRENYEALNVNYLIYSQQIWSVDRSGEGWRGMSDRGSTTANHYDHVHVTVY